MIDLISRLNWKKKIAAQRTQKFPSSTHLVTQKMRTKICTKGVLILVPKDFFCRDVRVHFFMCEISHLVSHGAQHYDQKDIFQTADFFEIAQREKSSWKWPTTINHFCFKTCQWILQIILIYISFFALVYTSSFCTFFVCPWESNLLSSACT